MKKIIVKPTRSGIMFDAHLEGDEFGPQSCGKTVGEAIGLLVMVQAEKLGIEISYLTDSNKSEQ